MVVRNNPQIDNTIYLFFLQLADQYDHYESTNNILVKLMIEKNNLNLDKIRIQSTLKSTEITWEKYL